LLTGAVKLTVAAVEEVAVAVPIVGAPGNVAGIIAALAALLGLSPMALVA
jgi:hypothetical protein